MKSGLRKFFSIIGGTTIGLFIFLAWFFTYLKVDSIFVTNVAGWTLFITRWMIIFGFSIGISGALIPDYVRSIFKMKFFNELLKFIIFALIGGIVFFGLILAVKGFVTPVLIISFPILIIYAWFVAYPEEILFRGMLQEILRLQGVSKFWRWTISTIIFALFHWVLGRSAITLIIYIPLGYLLSWVKDRYSPKSNFANAGLHFAYDVILLLFGIT